MPYMIAVSLEMSDEPKIVCFAIIVCFAFMFAVFFRRDVACRVSRFAL